MILRDRIDEVLEYYNYALVGLNGESTDNVVIVNTPTTVKPLYQYLVIVYGHRVSKYKGKIKVVR